jgi:hypothetical protein
MISGSEFEPGESGMPKASQEETVQIKVSSKLKKDIRRSALECDETVRTFILKALQGRGVSVSDSEIRDRRKVSHR